MNAEEGCGHIGAQLDVEKCRGNVHDEERKHWGEAQHQEIAERVLENPSASLAAKGPARFRKTSPNADLAARKIAAAPVVAAIDCQGPAISHPNRNPAKIVRIEAAGTSKATASA
jgi:hypothetical protein